jgi:hypothetical protein
VSVNARVGNLQGSGSESIVPFEGWSRVVGTMRIVVSDDGGSVVRGCSCWCSSNRSWSRWSRSRGWGVGGRSRGCVGDNGNWSGLGGSVLPAVLLGDCRSRCGLVAVDGGVDFCHVGDGDHGMVDWSGWGITHVVVVQGWECIGSGHEGSDGKRAHVGWLFLGGLKLLIGDRRSTESIALKGESE